MRISKKENYLEQVRNHMLFHYNHKNIYTVLEDLNLYFASGTEAGRTEEELCEELGEPKQLVRAISCDTVPNRASSAVGAYVTGWCILCFLCFQVVLYPGQLISCIAVAAIPAFLWYCLGSRSLLQIRDEAARAHRKEILYLFIVSALVIAEQVYIILLCCNFHHLAEAPSRSALIVHYISRAVIVLSVFVLTAAAYKLYKGYYLSLGSVFSSVGAICSSLSCSYYLLHLEKPGISFNIRMVCSLPFAVSVALSAIFYLALNRRRRQSWIHK